VLDEGSIGDDDEDSFNIIDKDSKGRPSIVDD
jgi:hypothetical protein